MSKPTRSWSWYDAKASELFALCDRFGGSEELRAEAIRLREEARRLYVLARVSA